MANHRRFPKSSHISRETPLAEVMSRNLIALQINDRASLVDTLMKAHPIHHLPVVDGKSLKGLISQSDLYRNMLSGFYCDSDKEQHAFLDNFMEIPNLMTEDPLTLAPENTLGEALDLVLEYRVGCVPVVNAQNELVGMVTTSDLLRILRQIIPHSAQPAKLAAQGSAD